MMNKTQIDKYDIVDVDLNFFFTEIYRRTYTIRKSS